MARRLRMLGVGADIGLTVVLQVVSSLAAFAFQIVVLQNLTMEESGVYFLAVSYMIIAAGLGDFGIVATVLPRLSVSRGVGTPAFKAALVLRICTVALSGLLLNLYLLIVGKESLLPFVNVAYLSVIISGKATGIRQLFEVLWRLQGRTYVITAISVIDTIIGLIAIWILSQFGKVTVMGVMVIFTFSNLPGFIAVIWPLMRKLRAERAFEHTIPSRFYKTLVASSFPVAMMAVLAQVSAQLETLIIESYEALSHADIAAYNAGIRPLTALIFIATTLSVGFLPIVSQHSKGMRSDSSFEFITSVGARILGTISILIALVCGLLGEKIMLLFGEEYVAEAYILQLYSIISGLSFLVVMFDHFLLAVGKRKQTLYGAALYLLLAMITEPWAIRVWGIRGMMYAKGAALCCMIVFQIFRFAPEIRLAAAKAIARLAPSAIVLFGTLLATSGMSLPPRIAIVTSATLASLLLLQTITREELVVLRKMKV